MTWPSGRCCCRYLSPAPSDCGQQSFVVAEESDAKFLQIRVGKMCENREIDVVFGERLRVLAKPQSFQPDSDVHTKD